MRIKKAEMEVKRR